MAASTENAVVVACCAAVAGEEALKRRSEETRAKRSRATLRSLRRLRAFGTTAYNPGVPHVIEPASSGRAKCRSCDQSIAKGELRFGERQPNAFGDGEMTLWFHLPCAAYSRPEAFLATEGTQLDATLAAAARFGIEHRRVPRLHGVERASSGRAHCRSCRELIDKGEWRIAIVFFEEYRFNPGGYIHTRCARAYFETVDLLDRVRHYSPDLTTADLAEIGAALAAGPPASS